MDWKAQEGSKRPQEHPKIAKVGPSGPPQRPTSLLRRLKTPPRAPKSSQEAPKRPPRGLQEAPKRRQETPKRPQEAPKRPQEAPKRSPRDPQEASKSSRKRPDASHQASLKRFAEILKNHEKRCRVLQKSRFGGSENHEKLRLEGKLGANLEPSLLIECNFKLRGAS